MKLKTIFRHFIKKKSLDAWDASRVRRFKLEAKILGLKALRETGITRDTLQVKSRLAFLQAERILSHYDSNSVLEMEANDIFE